MDILNNVDTDIVQNARERYGIHSADKRRSLSHIRSTFPEFEVEAGFKEKDELFDTEVREPKDHVKRRARRVLDYIFEKDEGICERL